MVEFLCDCIINQSQRMADEATPVQEEHVTVENQPTSDNTPDVLAPDADENEVKKANIDWNEEDIVLADKDNKTTKPEYYLRGDVKVGNKIVEDAIEDGTHPYDHPNFLVRWSM